MWAATDPWISADAWVGHGVEPEPEPDLPGGLLDGQYLYRGLLLGPNSPFFMQQVEGIEGVDVRARDEDLPRGHGSLPGPHYVAAKDIVLEVALSEPAVEMADYIAQFRAAFSVADSPLPLTWKRTGQPERIIYARPLQFRFSESVGTVDRLARLKVALVANDPRIYSATEHLMALPLYDAGGGGIEFPTEFPADFTAGASADAVLSNAGAADAYPLLRFFGPTDGGTVTAVSVANLTTGESQTITTPIGAGQILTVNNRAWITGSGEQVIGLDGASRYGSWEQPRVPLRLAPGDNLLRFTITGTSTAATAVASWRDTWLS